MEESELLKLALTPSTQNSNLADKRTLQTFWGWIMEIEIPWAPVSVDMKISNAHARSGVTQDDGMKGEKKKA